MCIRVFLQTVWVTAEHFVTVLHRGRKFTLFVVIVSVRLFIFTVNPEPYRLTLSTTYIYNA